jgi:hypothetical protein
MRLWLFKQYSEFAGSEGYIAAIAVQTSVAGIYGSTITVTVDGKELPTEHPFIIAKGRPLLSCGTGLCNDDFQLVVGGLSDDGFPLEKIKVTVTPFRSQSVSQTGWTWTLDGDRYEPVCATSETSAVLASGVC